MTDMCSMVGAIYAGIYLHSVQVWRS